MTLDDLTPCAQPPARVVCEMEVVYLKPVQGWLVGRASERACQPNAEDHLRRFLELLSNAFDFGRVGSHVVRAVQADIGDAQFELIIA